MTTAISPQVHNRRVKEPGIQLSPCIQLVRFWLRAEPYLPHSGLVPSWEPKEQEVAAPVSRAL